MLGHFWRVGALLLSWTPVASAQGQGQDSLGLARALERAEQFFMAVGPKPLPTARWLDGDRLAYSADGKAPWTVLDARTGNVLESGASDAAVGATGPSGPGQGPPGPQRSSTTSGRPLWTAQAASVGGATELTVSDAAGAARLRLPGAPNHGWSIPQQAWLPFASTTARSTDCPSWITAAPSNASATLPTPRPVRRCPSRNCTSSTLQRPLRVRFNWTAEMPTSGCSAGDRPPPRHS